MCVLKMMKHELKEQAVLTVTTFWHSEGNTTFERLDPFGLRSRVVEATAITNS
jgi:hypothetical protein